MKSEYQLNRLRSRRLSQLALHDNPPNHAHVSGLPLVWYIKWVASIILIAAIVLSSNNMYPYYMYVQSVGVALWLVVSFMWNDKALIVVNAIGLAVIINGIVKYLTLSP
jgi:hypothetical protein